MRIGLLSVAWGDWVETLRRLREDRALSLQDLADRSGVAKATIVALEAGRRPARPATRRKLAEALRVQPNEIVWPHPDADNTATDGGDT